MALSVPEGSITADKPSATAAGKWKMFDNSQLIVATSGGGFDWQIADIGALVPATAEIAYVKIWGQETRGNGWCSVRPYGSTSSTGTEVHTPVANVYAATMAMVAINDSKIERKCSFQSGATTPDMGIELWGYYELGH
jgi:hypothetical protein